MNEPSGSQVPFCNYCMISLGDSLLCPTCGRRRSEITVARVNASAAGRAAVTTAATAGFRAAANSATAGARGTALSGAPVGGVPTSRQIVQPGAPDYGTGPLTFVCLLASAYFFCSYAFHTLCGM